jgi:hypothetical protein
MIRLAWVLAACALAAPLSAGPDAKSWFTDVTKPSGLRFRHEQGTVLRWIPQVTGPGTALLDADGDGLLDVFLVQGTGLGDGPPPKCDPCPTDNTSPTCALFRSRGATFDEVAERAGVAAHVYGMAALAFDMDNDGYTDLAVSQFAGRLKLLRNNGDGTFTDAGARSGFAVPLEWAASLTALDRERDGFLDVYVGQYLRFGAADWLPDPGLKDEGKGLTPVTLLPGRYPPLPNLLLANNADGTFRDATEEAGVRDAEGQTLGALAADFDGDGWPDLMTANDGPTRSQVYVNDRTGKFKNASKGSWADEARGSMGFALGDADGSGQMDVYVTHWMNQPSLYRVNARKVRFVDQAAQRGLTSEIPFSGWAAGFLDVDNDGFDDLLQIGGHTAPPPDRPMSGRLDPHPTYLFRNDGAGMFVRVRGAPGQDPLEKHRVGRAAAFGDLDRDGAQDVVLNNNNADAEVWRGVPRDGAWIAVLPVGTRSCREGLGVTVTAERGTWTRKRHMVSGESFFSTNARAVMFGLGATADPITIRIMWASGRVEEWAGLPPRKYHRLIEGTGVTK